MTDTLKPCPGLTPGIRVHLPELSRRFSCDFHPAYHELIRRNEQWVVNDLFAGHVEAAQRLLEALGSLLACTGYPTADCDRLYDICNLTDWWLIVDDEFTQIMANSQIPMRERQKRARRYADDMWSLVLGGHAASAPGGWSPGAVRELFDRIQGRLAPDFFRHLLEALADFQQQGLSEEAQGLSIDAPDLPTYLDVRKLSAATGAYLIFAEYVLGTQLPQEVLASEAVQEYQSTVTAQWILPNDLLSFRKECFSGDHNNAVCFLRRAEGLSLQEAVTTIASYINDFQSRALGQYDRILTSPLGDRVGVGDYLKTLQSIGAANQRWSYITPRYHGQGFRWNGVTSGDLILFPDHTQFPGVRGDRSDLGETIQPDAR